MISIRLVGTVASALLSVGTLSWSSDATAQSSAATPTAGHADAMMAACPMAVPGTKVSAVDTANGETLVFTTTEDVAALRTRVHRMAEMHDQHHAVGGMHDGMMGGKVKMPPSNATVADVDSGASITLTPVVAADLPQLQAAVRAHASHMQQDGCGKMAKGQ
jgi:hypothetical protein